MLRVVVLCRTNIQVDWGAFGRYTIGGLIQLVLITFVFAIIDTACYGPLPGGAEIGQLPWQAVVGIFLLLSVRSRIFSPLDNSRPNTAELRNALVETDASLEALLAGQTTKNQLKEECVSRGLSVLQGDAERYDFGDRVDTYDWTLYAAVHHRFARALRAFESFVSARSARQADQRADRLERENLVLKRAVAVQARRLEATDGEKAALERTVSAQAERLRRAERTNYALSVHLHRASPGGMPDNRPPDVY